MRRTPLRRIASSTLKVAIVFCSRSRRGCSVPKRTSALAARWKTKSRPRIASVSAARVEQVALDQAEAGDGRRRVRRNSRWPVEKLSKPTTSWPARQQPVDQVAADEPGRAGDETTRIRESR